MKRSVWALAIFIVYQVFLLSIALISWFLAIGATLDIHANVSERASDFALGDWVLPLSLGILPTLIVLWFSYVGLRAFQSTKTTNEVQRNDQGR